MFLISMPGKSRLNVPADELLKENEMVTSLFSIHGNKSRQDGRHLDEGVGLGDLYSARFLENDHEVQTQIAEEGKGVTGIDGERRQNGKYLCLEVLVEPLDLFLVEFVEPMDEYPRFFESRQDLLHDAVVLFGNELARFFRDFVELLPGRPAAGIDVIEVGLENAEEPADTDHKVFIKVRTENRGKFEFFEGRGELVLRLFDHPPVELEPG